MHRKPILVLLIALMLPLATQAAKDNLTIPIQVPLQAGLNVPNAVLAECELERKLAKYLASEAKGPYGKIIMQPTVSAQTPGQALDIHITQILAPGGGKWSGPKSVTTEGTLYNNGQVLGTFTATRYTHKGKHTCRMLQNDAKAIAEDIGDWLKKPTMGAKLGDAK